MIWNTKTEELEEVSVLTAVDQGSAIILYNDDALHFLPNVLPVTVGSKVHFLNEDEFFHNVQSFTSKARFSIGRRAPGIAYSQKIKKPGVISLMCDIHSHMNAVILSLDTPYFTRVKEDGSYQIKDLPDGNYYYIFD